MTYTIRPIAQRGATLIVVMLVLLMVTIVGVLAIRTAMTSLNIATNAQVGQLLNQTADSPINQIYMSDLSKMMDLSGAIGLALADSKVDPGKEYVFCYKPLAAEKFASSLNMISLRIKSDKTVEVSDGSTLAFCDLTKDFGSKREAVVTQVAVKIPTDISPNMAPGALLGRGTNLSEGTIMPRNMVEQQRIRVTTTAVMPAFSADISKANNCMKENINDNTDADTAAMTTVAQCLSKLGIPVDSQVQDFNLQTLFEQIQAP
ncbi:PilX N-terminal domain-containing pilus assembly protein [Acinetobacter radioresistens]|jgi:hypothetical protein|uniref:pilus assembly PilX family protein n=1 Tax=Acinetobacter TaxID=469 RepID=UPI0002CE276F|nr:MULTISPECIES: PilX N-terminal domain-containing pilus assembly protein [Acinetobacter]ENV85678.1 hypothetical protein F940_01905 [Acinetobacter radioresistens NIPH 2130]EXB87804.1 putative type IV fimbrial biogenesis protein [Acinetobacter sp. 272263]MCK4077658.1 hypothetical protein [Acinetobacter radioresistens]MCK4084294.1 hypothetical protein [Acinetobacter radioresistens]MCK4098179.1 hypothetical protein [Acinetobacter radioresistens]